MNHYTDEQLQEQLELDLEWEYQEVMSTLQEEHNHMLTEMSHDETNT